MENTMMFSSFLVVFILFQISVVSGFSDQNYDMPDYKDHPCIRECEKNARPRTCKYTFVIENYYVLTKACYNCPLNLSDCYRPHCVATDGVQRGIKTANRQLPGPAIQVCQGDNIEVTIDNRMDGFEATSIHWHGVLQQGTPYMDGAALVTQCPIPSMSTFKYKFKANDPGTHYWHAHAGLQRADGLFGPFIVKQTENKDPHYLLYDHDLPEHVILINDWLNEMTVNRFSRSSHGVSDTFSSLMLINGKGRHQGYPDENGTLHYTPYAEFTVTAGKKYRFRMISGAILNCPMQISIDDHTMMVIASDGNPFSPYVVDSFNIFAGERFDFVLQAKNDTTERNYWIRAKGLSNCVKKKVTMAAILRYAGAPNDLPPGNTTYEDAEREGKRLNPWNKEETDDLVQITSMINEEPDDDTMTSEPDKKFYLGMDWNIVETHRFQNPELYPITSTLRNRHFYSPQINHISNYIPPAPPLTQFHDIPKDILCNAETVQKHCDKEWCSCVHMYQVAVGDLVELIVVDEGVTYNSNHPMHLHGFRFRVVAMEKLGVQTSVSEVKRLDEEGKINRTTTKAPFKDTVTVPDGGFTIIRFRADNPGVWFFHCHVQFHNEFGMGMLFRVGETKDLPPKPKNFPKCNSFHYDDGEEDINNEDDNNDNGNDNNNNKPTIPCSSSGNNIHYLVSIFLILYFFLKTVNEALL